MEKENDGRSYAYLQRENKAYKGLIDRMSGRINHLQYLLNISQKNNALLIEENEDLGHKIDGFEDENKKLLERLEKMQNTRSWKMTGWMRKIGFWMKV